MDKTKLLELAIGMTKEFVKMDPGLNLSKQLEDPRQYFLDTVKMCYSELADLVKED